MGNYLSESDYRIAEELGLKRNLVHRRVYEQGWDVERAITEPVNEQHHATGAWEQWKEIAAQFGVTYQNFRTRLSRGKTEAEAATTPPRKPRGRKVEREVFDVPYFASPKPGSEVTAVWFE